MNGQRKGEPGLESVTARPYAADPADPSRWNGQSVKRATEEPDLGDSAAPSDVVASEDADGRSGRTLIGEAADAPLRSPDGEQGSSHGRVVPLQNRLPDGEPVLTQYGSKAIQQASRQRPPRPLSYHELASTTHGDAASAAGVQTNDARELRMRKRDAGQALAVPSGEAVSMAPVLPPAATPMGPVLTWREPMAAAAPMPSLPRPKADAARDLRFAADGSLSEGPSPGRWDPIPTLRPSDSGWNRIAPRDNMSRPREAATENWSWLGREAEDVDEEVIRLWNAELKFAASLDLTQDAHETALSRPWALLSRFQQMQKMTPPPEETDPRVEEDARERAISAPVKSSRNG